MGDSMSFFSLFIALFCVFAGVQIRNGKTDFLGNAGEQVKPEYKKAYCKEMSIPIFLIAVVEIIDVALQYFMPEFGQWSLLVLGAGLLLAMGWISIIQRKYVNMQ